MWVQSLLKALLTDTLVEGTSMKGSALCLASLVAQLVKNPAAVQEKPSLIPGSESSLGVRDKLPTPVFLGFPWYLRWKRIRLQCGSPGLDP